MAATSHAGLTDLLADVEAQPALSSLAGLETPPSESSESDLAGEILRQAEEGVAKVLKIELSFVFGCFYSPI